MNTFILIVLLFIIVVIIVLLFKKQKSENSDENYTDKQRTIDYQVTFPDPNSTNEYRFYKFVQDENSFIISKLFDEMKKRNFELPEKYKTAIEQKIRFGEIKNPHNFLDFFGNKFDIIAIYYLEGDYINNRYDQLKFCFIQQDKIASIESFNVGAPLVSENDPNDWYKTAPYYPFEEIWLEHNLDKCLNNNVLVFRQNDFHSFYKLLNNKDLNYSFNFIIIDEVLEDKGLMQDNFEDVYKNLFPNKEFDKKNPYQLAEVVYELIDDDINDLKQYFHPLKSDTIY